MENKNKKRGIEETFSSIFPNIDIMKLKEILNKPSDYYSNINESDKQSVDEILLTDDSLSINDSETINTNFSDLNCKNSLDLDKQFRNREEKYRQVVRKAVTTQNLVSVRRISLKKILFMPDFYKRTLKSIGAKSGVGNNLNRLTVSSFSKKDTVFVVNVKGSQDTDYAFDFTTKRLSFNKENYKFLYCYISPNYEDDKTNNYRNKKDIVMSSYQNNMRNLDFDRFYFYNEERNKKSYIHHIQQVDKLCQKYSSNFLLTGFHALKGSRGDNQYQEKGLKILITKNKTPFVIFKEHPFQKPETTLNGFKWLFVFDKVNSDCFNSFKKFSSLIDFSKDKISGLTLLPNNVAIDEIEEMFNRELENKQTKILSYETIRYNNDPFIIVNNKVNYGNIHYDFVVIYNKNITNEINKNLMEKQIDSNFKILMGCISNICVTNGN